MRDTFAKSIERTSIRAHPTSSIAKNLTVLGIVLWALASVIAGWFGLFVQSGQPAMYFGLAIAAPVGAFAALYLWNGQFKAFVHSIRLPLIVGAHVWRFVGFGFIVAYLMGRLPAEFAIPEGLGDIVAALFAIPLARALHRGRPVRKWFVIWNVFGLVDLVSALIIGILYSEGPLGVLRTGASSALMTSFPIHLIPTFFVPLFIMLHALALLRRREVGGAWRAN